jgi:hypothetical protein
MVASFEDQISDLSPTHRVEPRRGLVQDEKAGLAQQRLGKRDPLDHPFGITADLKPLRPAQANPTQGIVGSAVELLSTEPDEASAQPYELRTGQIFVRRWILRHETNVRPSGTVTDGSTKELRSSGSRLDEVEKNLDGGALPSTIGSKKSVDGPWFNREVELS